MSRRAALLAALLLAGCASAPPPAPAPPPLTGATPEAMVAAVRAAGRVGEAELAVQPLRDPMVEDLRQQAATLERQQRYPDAAAALDRALAASPDDPALLQERAEAALLLRAPAEAETLARRAWDVGAKVGPLCRRHWETVRWARLVANDAAGAAIAATQVQACTLAAPPRY